MLLVEHLGGTRTPGRRRAQRAAQDLPVPNDGDGADGAVFPQDPQRLPQVDIAYRAIRQ
ncbi:hypothetical protein [Sinorhizobium medicae]